MQEWFERVITERTKWGHTVRADLLPAGDPELLGDAAESPDDTGGGGDDTNRAGRHREGPHASAGGGAAERIDAPPPMICHAWQALSTPWPS